MKRKQDIPRFTVRACSPLLAGLRLWGGARLNSMVGSSPGAELLTLGSQNKKQAEMGRVERGRGQCSVSFKDTSLITTFLLCPPHRSSSTAPYRQCLGTKHYPVAFGRHFKSNCNNIFGDFFPQRLNTASLSSLRSHLDTEQPSQFVRLLWSVSSH